MKKFDLQVGLIRYSDIAKDMTLRNANEHRRLRGQLQHLDLQLHNKLVSMDAEMMELRSSPYAKRKKLSPKVCYNRERAKSDYGLTPIPRSRPTTVSGLAQTRASSRSLVLPEINLDRTSLVNNTGHEMKKGRVNCVKTRDLSPVSDRYSLQPPSSPSLYRPSSLPDLRDVENSCHLSPKSTRKLLLGDVKHRPEIHSAKVSSITQNNSEGTKIEKKQPLNTNVYQDNQFNVPDIKCENSDNNDDNNGDKTDENPEGVNNVFLNSMLTRTAFGEEDLELTNTPDLASLGFMDFNDVIDKRLQQSQQEPPTEEEMRKVRYLRWREKDQEIDIVKEVFEKRGKNQNDGGFK